MSKPQEQKEYKVEINETILCLAVGVILVGLIIFDIITIITTKKVNNQRLDFCITLEDKIGLDPNNDKITFIKNCSVHE